MLYCLHPQHIIHVSYERRLSSEVKTTAKSCYSTTRGERKHFGDSIKFQEWDKIVSKVNKRNYFIMCDPHINLLNDVLSDPLLSSASQVDYEGKQRSGGWYQVVVSLIKFLRKCHWCRIIFSRSSAERSTVNYATNYNVTWRWSSSWRSFSSLRLSSNVWARRQSSFLIIRFQ